MILLKRGIVNIFRKKKNHKILILLEKEILHFLYIESRGEAFALSRKMKYIVDIFDP